MKHCLVDVEWSEVVGQWYWTVRTPDGSCEGFERDFDNALNRVREAMEEMGVEA